MPTSSDAAHLSALVGTGVIALHTEGLFFRRLRPHQGEERKYCITHTQFLHKWITCCGDNPH
jgi:hypothetical protein